MKGALMAIAVLLPAQSGPTPAPDLATEVAALDAALFAAFNDCDTSRFAALLADDLEFFHDRNGLWRKPALVDDFAQSCARRSRGEQPRVRRQLDGTGETYPIKDYGAAHAGTHRFYEIQGGKEKLVGSGRFLNIWRKNAGAWKLARVVSYDHQAAP